MSPSRFTLLGGRGFIGSHLWRLLEREGCECFVPERGDGRLFTEELGHLVYCVGLTADFRSRPLETVEAHVCLLRRLLGAGRFESLTYLSSTRVYAGVRDTRETARLRVDPNDPGDLYNLSKLMGESLCLHGGRPNMKVARLSNAVGVRTDSHWFIGQLLEQGRARGEIELETALDARRDYLAVEDAVVLLRDIARSRAGGIFNVASGEAVANREVLELLERCLGFRARVSAAAPPWDFTPIDITRIRTEFGFRPRRFADYFPEVLDAYRHRWETA